MILPPLPALFLSSSPFYLTYNQIHAYVRHRYSQHWGQEHMPEPRSSPASPKYIWHLPPARAPIPAHLMGNMWAQAWQATFNMVSPFPEESSPFDEVTQTTLVTVMVISFTFVSRWMPTCCHKTTQRG